MIENSNICKVCGGILRFEWIMAFEQCVPRETRFRPKTGMIKLCPGHGDREAPQQHNGSLDNYKPYSIGAHATIELQLDYPNFSGGPVQIHGGYGDCENASISLDPAQALSLLEWLLQERQLLGELARRRVSEEEAPHD